SGAKGFSGDGGPATLASLQSSLGVAVDANGVIYAGDESSYAVRRIDPVTGIITTIAGIGNTKGFSGDGGPDNLATMDVLENVMVDKCGNLYIADFFNQRVRKVTLPSSISVTPASVTICK